jgi:hypothetical protein
MSARSAAAQLNNTFLCIMIGPFSTSPLPAKGLLIAQIQTIASASIILA